MDFTVALHPDGPPAASLIYKAAHGGRRQVEEGVDMHFPWLGIFFWVGVFTWFSIMAWSRYLREQERQKTLRAFAERGQPLDPETLEKLFPKSALMPEQRADSPEAVARGLMIGGIIAAFVAVGLAIGAQVIGRMESDALWGMSGAAAIVGCAGLGLITASVVTRRQNEAERRALLGTADKDR
jgi:hypothetical protein